MAVFSIEVTDVTPQIEDMVYRLSNLMPLWDKISGYLRGVVDSLFDNKGGLYGRSTWLPIAESMRPRKRIGTDGFAHGTYGDSMDRILIASGLYKRSFKQVTKPRPSFMIWGSVHPLAKYIHLGGWNRKDVAFSPRFAMPDPNDPVFLADVRGIVAQYLGAEIKLALTGGKK